ncbi:MAG: trigger factor [Deltaproteobacteria bacterium]|nr:trigger factor [Deltaproteobacteria bacterium]
MKVEIEEISPVQRKLWIEVPSEEVDKNLDRAYRNLKKKARVKGFRPGKAPRSILERLFKKQVEEEVTQDLLRNSLDEALKEVNLHPLMLQIPQQLPDIIQGDNFKYSVELEITPEFTVENYLGLKLTVEPVEVTEAMIDQRLREIQELNAWVKPVSEARPIQKDDFVLLDYEAFQEGKPIPGGSNLNYHLEIGAGRFNVDFELQLIGLNQGDEANIRVDLPENFFNPALAGKTIDFTVKIHEIKEKELPVLDDDFAKALGGSFQTLEDLRESIKQDIINKKEQQRQAELRDQVLDHLIRQTAFEVPPFLIRQEQEYILREQLEALQRRGINLAGLDKEKMLDKLRDLAERRTRSDLILEKIADQEGITVSNAELEIGYQQLAERLGEEAGRIREFYQQHQRVEEFRSRLRKDKALQRLIEHAEIVAPLAATETAQEGT